MKERRKAKRLKDEKEIDVMIVDDEKNIVNGQKLSNQRMDISVTGAKITSNIFLPVDTLITIKMKLKNLGKIINTMGKVKWIKGRSHDESYEAGVEFVDTSEESILELEEFIGRGVDRHSSTEK